jgi:aspartokinase
MVAVGASEVNLSIVIDEQDLPHALDLVHHEFFGGELDNSIFQSID